MHYKKPSHAVMPDGFFGQHKQKFPPKVFFWGWALEVAIFGDGPICACGDPLQGT
jgi:hypothetical protein